MATRVEIDLSDTGDILDVRKLNPTDPARGTSAKEEGPHGKQVKVMGMNHVAILAANPCIYICSKSGCRCI